MTTLESLEGVEILTEKTVHISANLLLTLLLTLFGTIILMSGIAIIIKAFYEDDGPAVYIFGIVLMIIGLAVLFIGIHFTPIESARECEIIISDDTPINDLLSNPNYTVIQIRGRILTVREHIGYYKNLFSKELLETLK